jgi:L-threonylcarbamoyladenylate synthase
MALALIRELGEPVAATSANRSGGISPTSAEHVRAALGNDLDLIIDGGSCPVGIESTLLDLTATPPAIVRVGAVATEAIQSVIGFVSVLSDSDRRNVRSHLRLILVPPDRWPEVLAEWHQSKKRFGTLSLRPMTAAESPFFCRRATDLSDYASALFAVVHEAGAADISALLAEAVPKEGLGAAIMDRLEKMAAGGTPPPPLLRGD